MIAATFRLPRQNPRAFLALATPGVVIDGKVVHAGGVPARSKVESWF